MISSCQEGFVLVPAAESAGVAVVEGEVCGDPAKGRSRAGALAVEGVSRWTGAAEPGG